MSTTWDNHYMQMAWNTYIYTYQSQATRDSLQTDHTSYHGSFLDCKILTILPSFHFSQNLHLPPSFLLGYPPFHCQNPHPLPSFPCQNPHPSHHLPVRIPSFPCQNSLNFPVRIPPFPSFPCQNPLHFPVRILTSC